MAFQITELALQFAILLVLSVFLYALTRKQPTDTQTATSKWSFPKLPKDPLKPQYLTDEEAYELEQKERQNK